MTADFSSDHVNLTTMSKKTLFEFVCFRMVLLALLFFLRLLHELRVARPELSCVPAVCASHVKKNSLGDLHAFTIWKLLGKLTSPSLEITFHSSQMEHYDAIAALSLVDFKAFSDNGYKTSVGLAY